MLANETIAAECMEFLKGEAERNDAVSVCNVVLDDKRFPIWSGSSKEHQHHYGKHGLIIHTTEVIKLCYLNNELLGSSVNKGRLFLAGLFHDAGKMWDYEPVYVGNAYSTWRGTQHKRRIHHISRSALVWKEAVTANNWLDEELVDDVLHAILAHHGMREWGSPVSPNTKLAWLLHLCDGISARIDDCDKFDRH